MFSIASLDSFEQEMASAQADLHIASNDFVPIRYRTKNELLYVSFTADENDVFNYFFTNKIHYLESINQVALFCFGTRFVYLPNIHSQLLVVNGHFLLELKTCL